MRTLLLDPVTWDLKLDASGNIAVAEEPYAIAQDVASAARLFLGELWYDTTQGVPYFEAILGKRPSLGFMQAKYLQAALTVPQVLNAKTTLTEVGKDRILNVPPGKIVLTISGTAAPTPPGAGPALPWYVSAVTGQVPGQFGELIFSDPSESGFIPGVSP